MNSNFSRKIWNDIFQLSQAVFRVTHLFPKDEILKRHLREKITEILYQSSPNFAFKNDQNLIKEIHDFRGLLFTTKNCNFINEKNLEILIKECVNLIEFLDSKNQENFSQFNEINNQISDTQSQFHYQPIMDKIGNQNVNKNLINSASVERGFQSHSPASKNQKNSASIPPALSKLQRGERSFRLLRQRTGEASDDFASNEIGFSILNSRQQKILDYFQKTTEEKNHLKDISKELKFIHPRTLRQDLKCLCDNGHLLRTGSGPGSFYSFVKK